MKLNFKPILEFIESKTCSLEELEEKVNKLRGE